MRGNNLTGWFVFWVRRQHELKRLQQFCAYLGHIWRQRDKLTQSKSQLRLSEHALLRNPIKHFRDRPQFMTDQDKQPQFVKSWFTETIRKNEGYLPQLACRFCYWWIASNVPRYLLETWIVLVQNREKRDNDPLKAKNILCLRSHIYIWQIT